MRIQSSTKHYFLLIEFSNQGTKYSRR